MKPIRSALAACVVLASAGLALAQPGSADAPARKPAAEEKAKPFLKAGDPAPALSIEKWVKGEPVTGFEKGKTYVVEFWATWCGPCIAAMPHLTELQRDLRSKGLTVIGVTSGDDNNTQDDVKKLVEKMGPRVGYAIAWDNGNATSDAFMEAAGRSSIPTSFVVDKDGKIAYIGHPMTLDFVLDKVLAGAWDYTSGPTDLRAYFKGRSEVFEAAREEPDTVIEKMDAYAAKYPSPALASQMRDTRFRALTLAGRPADAKAAGTAIVDKHTEHRDAQGLNEVAWFIVDPDADIPTAKRDLDLALRAATEAVKLTDSKDGAILDTLARVHYLKGDHAKAVELQRKAVEVAPEPMKEDLEKVLKDYEKAAKSST